MLGAFWHGFEKRAELKSTTKLEPQQERVLRRLDKNPGLLVYHGLGSGKTLSSLAATQGMKTDVVVPAALRGNYAKEVEKHTTRHKPNVMSYEAATKRGPTQGAKALVIDEAHSLGDPASKRTQALVGMAPGYDRRVLLTGTPIRNYPAEIAPLLRAVRGDKAVPLDPKAFNDQFVEEVQHRPGLFAKLRGVKPGTTYRMKNQSQFTDLVKGFVDYHAPSNENFPSVSHEVVETPMDTEQRKYYDFVMGKAGPALAWKIRHGMPPSKQEAKQLNTFLTGARQVSNSTAAFGGKGLSPKVQTAVKRLKDKVDKDKNFRGLVYSNFLDSGVKNYAAQLEEAGISHTVFDGSMSDKSRKQAVQDYNEGRTKVLLISGAGAQGLDLKGTKLIQLLEPHWNEARLAQATGRGIRHGSHAHLPEEERHVHVERYHSTIPQNAFQRLTRQKKDMSVDQYLAMMSKDKEQLNDQFLSVLRQVGQRE